MKLAAIEAIVSALADADGTRASSSSCAMGSATMSDPGDAAADRQRARAFARHAYEQMLAFRALSFREEVQALEAMADVVRLQSNRSAPEGQASMIRSPDS